MTAGAFERSCRSLTLWLVIATLASGIYLESGPLLTLFGAALAVHFPLLVRDARRAALPNR